MMWSWGDWRFYTAVLAMCIGGVGSAAICISIGLNWNFTTIVFMVASLGPFIGTNLLLRKLFPPEGE
jgi:uncharacterized membrane protein